MELEVEKKLGLDGKEQIEKYGIEPFIEKCKESVWKYKGMWEDFSDTVGFWADMEHPYVTYDNDYIESEWWALKQIYDKGLLYKGFKIVPYCPRCGTPLSTHEVAQGYKDRQGALRHRPLQGQRARTPIFSPGPRRRGRCPPTSRSCVNPDETYVQASKRRTATPIIWPRRWLDTVLGKLAKDGTPPMRSWKNIRAGISNIRNMSRCSHCAGESRRNG